MLLQLSLYFQFSNKVYKRYRFVVHQQLNDSLHSMFSIIVQMRLYKVVSYKQVIPSQYVCLSFELVVHKVTFYLLLPFLSCCASFFGITSLFFLSFSLSFSLLSVPMLYFPLAFAFGLEALFLVLCKSLLTVYNFKEKWKKKALTYNTTAYTYIVGTKQQNTPLLFSFFLSFGRSLAAYVYTYILPLYMYVHKTSKSLCSWPYSF